ncbi:uncharacterized protein (TIGR02246 family) [Edaphobacter aggregans]|uniref:Uncharacterized protein (TIGR02246 family) n=1 Tax=Edaphobacter aggregans TaxID=570835 RepID=A0A3R9NRQ9_9BACT|nr:SgcJ/EcaC family oxidoreductase [Edaphobacter aggregans]RSL15358.1 uncharacterized protein (TIGR02246 family) [Edaphobacter aggregans]
MSTKTDEQQIRALIDTWAEATRDGDLTALLHLVTEDVVFLTAGNIPMRRQDFATGFKSMIEAVNIEARSNIQEISINGDVAVCWNLLEVKITPLAGGATVKRAGNTLTVLRRGDDGRWRIWRDANMLAPA